MLDFCFKSTDRTVPRSLLSAACPRNPGILLSREIPGCRGQAAESRLRRAVQAVTLMLSILSSALNAAPEEGAYTRDFWSPTYHVERLAYCFMDGKICGKPVATQYCHLMGYETLTHEEIEHNVGLTNLLDSNSVCRGWGCDGFKLIQCSNKITHQPTEPYYNRLKAFAFPRFAHYRVAWCMTKNQQCGKPAAYSFCRRLGYEKVQSFQQDKAVPATRTLGDEALCFGSGCRGFREIICYR